MKRCIILILILALLAGAAAAQDAPQQVDGRKSGYLFMAAATRALQDDDFLNPGFFATDQGKALWTAPDGSSGSSASPVIRTPRRRCRGLRRVIRPMTLTLAG